MGLQNPTGIIRLFKIHDSYFNEKYYPRTFPESKDYIDVHLQQ